MAAKKKISATEKSSITKFPSFMCIQFCRNRGDSNGNITSAVEFPALGFNVKGDQMPYDLSATVHHKPTKGGKGGTCNHKSGSCMMMIEFLQ